MSDAREVPRQKIDAQATGVTNAPTKLIVVLAAVVEQDGRFLVARRLEGTHLAGMWEFPGGKCERDETHETCLRRELREELGVDAVVGEEIVSTEHAYPERTVRLHFRRTTLAGTPQPLLGQQLRWVTRAELGTLELPPADRELIEILTTSTD
jgi:mutator protein MutT